MGDRGSVNKRSAKWEVGFGLRFVEEKERKGAVRENVCTPVRDRCRDI
jgi:hypothetical protein